jgi:SAM-dependent methyltransferase
MPYQSFENEPGDSNSFEKLKALKIPRDLVNKSFLDVGCNAGFFCIEAKKCGASRVIGLDINKQNIIDAKQRANNEKLDIQFIHDSWDNLPNENFDYILFTSSLHYVENPILFFKNIYNHLNDNGTLILECGVLNNGIYSPSVQWTPRVNGSCFHPRLDVLLYTWLKSFAVRDIGQSVLQGGDPIAREVFHYRKWKTSVIFVVGKGGSGKSNLSLKLLNTKNVIQTDTLFFKRQIYKSTNKEEIELQKYYNELFCNIENVWNIIKDKENIIQYLQNILIRAINLYKGSEIVIVEGYGIRYLIHNILPILQENGFSCWTLHKGEINE